MSRAEEVILQNEALPADTAEKLKAIIDKECAHIQDQSHPYAELIWSEVQAVAAEWQGYEAEWSTLPPQVVTLLKKYKQRPVRERIKSVAASRYFKFEHEYRLPHDEVGEYLNTFTEWEYYLLQAAAVHLRDELGGDAANLTYAPLFSFLLMGGGPYRLYPKTLYPQLLPLFWGLPLTAQQQWLYEGPDYPLESSPMLDQALRLAGILKQGSSGVVSESFRRAGDHTRPLGDALQAALFRPLHTIEGASELTTILKPYYYLSQQAQLFLTQGMPAKRVEERLIASTIHGEPLLEATFHLLRNQELMVRLSTVLSMPLVNTPLLEARSYDHYMALADNALRIGYCAAALLIAAQLLEKDPLAQWRPYPVLGEVSLPGNSPREADLVFIEGVFNGMWKQLTHLPAYFGDDKVWQALNKWDTALIEEGAQATVHLVEVKSKLGLYNLMHPAYFSKKHYQQMIEHLRAMYTQPWQALRWEYHMLVLHPFGNTLLPNRELYFSPSVLRSKS